MVIHFTASRFSVIKNIEVLRAIVGIIHKRGHVLARDWIEPQYHVMAANINRQMSPEKVYDLNMDAIERADLVIIEGSEPSFGAGLQVATAISKKKPILLIIKKDSTHNESMLSQGAHDVLFTRKEYEGLDDVQKIVGDFIEENTFNTKDLRFNFVIDRQLHNYIRLKSFKTKKTKAEIVRELLIRDMEREEK